LATINLITVCGPTASGKTRLGVELALFCSGEIVSVDSRQVYRHMDIGTGKDLDEYRTPAGVVPYHLINMVEPHQVYTLWQFQRDFYQVFREIRSRGRMPVAVGGTGLYLEAALRNYEIPNVPEDEALRQELMQQPRAVLEAQLKARSPELHARMDLSSKKRIVRALEVALYGRDHPVEWGQKDPPEIHPLVIGVCWEREELRRRIQERLDRRLEQGLVEEVEKLLEMGIDERRFGFFGMEYRHVTRFLRGEVPFEKMRKELLRDIGRLAKRQETYFRGMERRGTEIHWVEQASAAAAKKIVDAALGK